MKKMKKRFVSLTLALVLLLAAAPGAYALAPLPGGATEPTVYTCADVKCNVGDIAVVSVNAQSPDGGNLSYQWYRSLDGTNIGGTMILNATGNNYYADTTQTGTAYYFCAVTNSSINGTSTVISSVIAVTVENNEPVIEGIGVLTLPNKTQYKEGDRLVTDGLSIRVYTNQGYYDVSAGLEVSPALLTVSGTQTITVRYQGKSCTFTVEVEADKEVVQSISISSLPAKTSYTVGDRLDTTGLSIRVVTNKQVKDVTEGFTCTPMVFSTSGSQQVKVIYGTVNTTFTVQVAERSTPSPSPTATATASPSPTATASPSPSSSANASPSPSPTHTVTVHEPHETGAGSTFLQIVLLLALLGLVGIGAYVYTVQRKNRK